MSAPVAFYPGMGCALRERDPMMITASGRAVMFVLSASLLCTMVI